MPPPPVGTGVGTAVVVPVVKLVRAVLEPLTLNLVTVRVTCGVVEMVTPVASLTRSAVVTVVSVLTGSINKLPLPSMVTR